MFLLHSHVPCVSSSHLHDLFYANIFLVKIFQECHLSSQTTLQVVTIRRHVLLMSKTSRISFLVDAVPVLQHLGVH